MATSSAATGGLHVLRDPINPLEDGVDIILVPGIGTAMPRSWPVIREEWFNSLPDHGRGTRILSYEYDSPFAVNKPSWESILMQGYELLQQMNDRRSEFSASIGGSRPIIIICHSLGGIIVKQALCVANKQFQRYGSIMNAIAGVVFLSTPHRFGDLATTFVRFKDVLDMTTGRSHKFSNASVDQEGAILLDLADRFEGISLRTPILSVYELRESKKIATTLRSKYQLLVGREACITGALLETVIGLNLNHHDTCLFTHSVGGEGLRQLNQFFHDTLRDATNLVTLRLEDQEYQYATMSAYSPTMSEIPLKGERFDQSEPSNQATNMATEGTSLSGFEVLHSATPNIETSKSIRLPCFLLSIHSANADFCGREDVLDRIAAELLPSKKSVTASRTTLRQFALCGFGGIGKTEIAREFARRYKSSFDAVFWIVADEVAKLDHHYQQVSLALGLEDAAECKNQVISRELVKGWLSSPRKHLSGSNKLDQGEQGTSEAAWLLIFDNADDPMILADYWPQGSGSILITSRDPLAKSMFTRNSSGLDLGPLTPQDSLNLLNHLTGSSGEPEAETAGQISKAFGGVPLAISQMASIIRRQDLTFEEFLELWADHEEHANLYETKFDTSLVTYRHSMSTVWAFEKLRPYARQLLEVISFLDPDVIGEDLLMGASTEMLSDGLQFKKSIYIEARAELLQSSLIHRDKQQQQISVHRIVQDAILATMETSKKRSMFQRVVQVLWADWPSAMPKPSRPPTLPQPKSAGGRLHIGRWPACAAIYPHVLRMHQLWSTIADPSEATRLHFAKLLGEAAWYQKERGRTQGFDGFFDTALTICESSTHLDRDSVLADLYFCLGAIAMDASDFDSSRVHKEQSFDLVAKICRELDTEDERLYLAYAERGISRIQDKRYAEGEADLKEALRIRKSFGNYIPRSGEANLSWALLAQGKLDECNELLLSSLAGREKALGKNDRESVRTGLILYALGNLRAEQSQWDESFEYHKRAWQHMRDTVGDRDFYTANVTYKIAEHLIRTGENDEAVSLINTALEVWSVDPNAHKPEIARATFLKGKLFESSGRPQKAAVALRVAGRMRKQITNEDRDVASLREEDFKNITPFWAQ